MSDESHSRKVSTIIAALRFWQRCGRKKSLPEYDVATDCGHLKPLSVREIDRLAESINLGDIVLVDKPISAQSSAQTGDRHS